MTRVESINALAELERVNWRVEPIGEDEVRVVCPAHDDSKPSASLNVRKNVWSCHACHAGGDVVSLLALIMKVERKTMLVELGTRYDLGIVKSIAPSVVEGYHEKIWSAGPLLSALRERGLTDAMIRRARLGYHEGRITIPIYDMAGRVINIRRYLPGAPEKKMVNTRGYGGPMLYQIASLKKADKVWICGGELKALLVESMLEEHGIAAVSGASGEGEWDASWNELFVGKEVWVCMDVDAAGVRAARMVAGHVVQRAAKVRIVELPLDKKKHPKGDVSDLVGKEKATAGDLVRLMTEAREYQRGEGSQQVIDLGPPMKVSLAGAALPTSVGRRLQLEAVISAVDTVPYLVPKSIRIACSRDQNGCPMCPVLQLEQDAVTGFADTSVPSTSAAVLDMVNCHKTTQHAAIMEGLKIPDCKAVKFQVRDHYAVIDARLVPKLEISGEGENNVVQPALIIGDRLETNSPYLFTGASHPHPRTQQATLVLDSATESQDSLSSFQPSESELEELKVFRPKAWTTAAVQEKLDEIYSDLETNVTAIFQRRDLHLVMDLAFHSALFFDMDGTTVNGWLNALILGDSAQGKSEASTRLMRHYGLGERVECKNATTAGLLGGVQQLGNRWFVSWGVIPMHDRRLVFLEELKGASTEVIGKLTDMRSSGIAEIPKIERRRTHSRTRIVAISNPRGQRSMDSYGFGVEAIKELIGGLEDVRRFDIALIVTSKQVDAQKVNALKHVRPKVEHRATSALCRKLILWAWTLKPQKIDVGPARQAIADAGSKLCVKYDESLPLVDAGTIQHKIARLAVALAARTYSRHDEHLVVRPCHVELVWKLLDRLYSSRECGYLDYSTARRRMSTMTDEPRVKKYLLATRHPADLVKQLLCTDNVSLQDIQDWTEADRDTAQSHMSFFVRKHALRRVDRGTYVKSADFIELLKRMDAEGIAEVDDEEDEM